jgi:hypothetical protein
MGSWYQPGTHGVPRQGRRGEAVPVRRACGERPANPTPESGMSDPQVLRFCQAGHYYPPRLDRTNRHSPMGVPWQQTGTRKGSWARAT